MTSQTLKLVMVPWGTNDFGDDVWLLENALVFGLESIFEHSADESLIQFADLFEQLGGEQKRSAVVPPYTETELRTLASKTPPDTHGIIDGLVAVTRDENDGSITAIEIAPRLFELDSKTFTFPDAFVFSSFSKSDGLMVDVDDLERWLSVVLNIGETLLETFDRTVPSNVGPETLRITSSWPAYSAFLKGKRGAKTTEEKLGYYRQATRLDPNFYWAHFNSGQLYKGQEDYHSARREFLAAINGAGSNSSQLGDIYFELGLCSIFLGDTKTARNFWDEALRYAPSNPTLLINIAGTYEQEEDWARAIDLHQQALNLDPQSYKALVNLARLKAQVGNVEAAIPLYEKALVMRPDDALRHAILGGCYLSIGDDGSARSYFEKASELDPPGSRRDFRIDESEPPPSPGDYARQELRRVDEEAAKQKQQEAKKPRGWKWFGR